MRVASGTKYRLQCGHTGYLFVQFIDSPLSDGEVQVFKYTYDGEIWRSDVFDARWCDGVLPTNYARRLWDKLVREDGFVYNLSDLFASMDGTVAS